MTSPVGTEPRRLRGILRMPSLRRRTRRRRRGRVLASDLATGKEKWLAVRGDFAA